MDKSKIIDSVMESNERFKLDDLVVEREKKFPYFWLVKKDGVVIDRDQYSNDIRSRFESGEYKKAAVIEKNEIVFESFDGTIRVIGKIIDEKKYSIMLNKTQYFGRFKEGLSEEDRKEFVKEKVKDVLGDISDLADDFDDQVHKQMRIIISIG